MAVSVETTAGTIVIIGDAMLRKDNIEPCEAEKWRYWVQARFVNTIDGWKSVEEIDKRADYILTYHDEADLEHEVYPFDGMKLRKRYERIPGFNFYFSGLPE
jgi:hypothetical protein